MNTLILSSSIAKNSRSFLLCQMVEKQLIEKGNNITFIDARTIPLNPVHEKNSPEMENLAKKMSKGNFDLDDFAKQLKQMGNMGGVSGILSMLPGVSKAQKLMAENKISDSLINHQIAIINSMTKKERADPNLIKASRKIRISKGSGTRVQDVNKLLKQFLQSQKMMKRMKSMGKGGMPNDLMQKLQGNFPPKLN